MIRRVRGLERFPERAAPAIARALESELRRSIAAGAAPDGTAWKPTQDGRVPLRGAARALTVRATGAFVLARLTGVEARHHFGWVRGGLARPILPTTSVLPSAVARAVTRAAVEEFRRAMDGGRAP
jgi:hypothetical protein